MRADNTADRLAALLPFPADHPIAVLGWPAACAAALDERPDLDTIVIRPPGGSGAHFSRRLRTSTAAVRVLPVHEAMAATPEPQTLPLIIKLQAQIDGQFAPGPLATDLPLPAIQGKAR